MTKNMFSLWEYFIVLIKRFLSKKINYAEDEKFFEDDDNLYNAEGGLTPGYKAKIKEYEEYIEENPMCDFLMNEHQENEIDKTVIDGICEFTDKRHELIKEYDRKQDEYGELFNPHEFAAEMATVNIVSTEEKIKAKNAIDEILETDINEMLYDSDSDVKEEVKGVFQEAMKGGEK